ncbi:MAG: DUF1660 domain-containing protein [Lactococcus lactis]|jgi:hypothetical protein|nr:DUF1660 domain-containing protein [Lactococcus lactis]MCI2139583.1 DUF1660 domain-containing protein [Lactococcus lactis]MCI2189570.1 DUF1660 domain-containing protein [Lactococcus lactis]
MKLLCKLFGHKWENALYIRVCKRCEKIEWVSSNSGFEVYDRNLNRSDLDESSGSHEKWLDKHLD